MACIVARPIHYSAKRNKEQGLEGVFQCFESPEQVWPSVRVES